MKKSILTIAVFLFGILSALADNISVADVTIEPGGTATVGICLNNTETNLVSFQMDLTLPEGISVNKAGCSLSSRFTDEDQELTIGRLSNGDIRLTSTSFSLTPIAGTSGEIITLSLTAAANSQGGTATISNIRFATSNSDKLTLPNTTFNIICNVPATGISLNQTTLSFTAANQTATLTATVTPSNATNKSVTWTSSNTSVATVSSSGVVTAKANGTATITAKTADGTNLTATCTVTVAIPKNVSSLTISSIDAVTYNGLAHTPAVTVKDGNTTLTEGTDYTVSYSNNINAGTATVTITGKGNYTGTKTVNFTINAKNASYLTISSISAVTYNGSAHTPTVTVKDGSTTLTSGTHYTVAYSNNINAGTATVTITGKGNYTGTKSANFTINAKNVSGLTISSIAAQTYTGSALTPTVTVKDGSTTLTSGTHYTVSYSNNTNAGTATVTITGKGNYTGTKTANFTINAKNASYLTISSISTVTYNGSAHTPAVTVKDGSTTLTSGTHYTVAYSNNINAGTATVTITGMGNYTGTKSASFTINKAPLTVMAQSYIITQGDPLPTYGVTYSGFVNNETSSVLTTQPTISCSATSTSAPGTYDINVSCAVADNYSFTYVNGTLTINAKSVSGLTISSIDAVTYTGLAQTPTVTVMDGSTTLTEGTDYTIAYSDNINAGTATVTITGKGNYMGTKTASFTINKAPLTITADSYTITPGDPLPTYEVTYSGFVNNETSSVLTTQPTISCSATSTSAPGSYEIIVSGAVADNYSFTYVNGTLTINAKSVSGLTISSIDAVTYNGLAQTPAITVMDGSTTLTEGTDYTVAYSNNINAGTATVTITGKGNYTGIKTASFTINKAPLTVTAQSYTITQGDPLPTYGITYSGFVNNETSSVLTTLPVISCSAISSSAPGTYEIIASGAVADNYSFTYVNGTLTIEAIANIQFVDDVVKSICVSHWDTNNDGELSYTEAAAVTILSDYFRNNYDIMFFNELAYFTGLTSIGDFAFEGCSGLTSVTIPTSVTSIDGHAFRNCSDLTSLTIPNSVTSIGDFAFDGCSDLTSVEIPNSVTSIGVCAFSDCSSLTSVEIPNSVTSIGQSAFSLSGLTSITIPNSVTSISKYAFNGCSSLTLVEIPNSVTSIGDGAFQSCGSLTSVTIPNSVTSIGQSAFSQCGGLTSLEIPNSVTRISQYAFSYCLNLTSLEIPNSVTNIGDYAFYECSRLTSLAIPNSVTSIGKYAFASCTGLTGSLTIPNSVTSIGKGAFEDCNGLTSLEIPNSVTSIGDEAFNGCSALTEVTVEIEVPLTISANVFSNRANAALFVPAFCTAAYEAAPYWQDFKFIKVKPSSDPTDPNIINFADVKVRSICVSRWDMNNDGKLSYIEAAAVTDIGNEFTNNTEISSFDELQYFTGLASIGQSAFYGCGGLTSITIPNSVTNIGDNAFYYCTSLTSVEIPNSVTSIGNSAFQNCSGLTSVVIPNSVWSIGENAFNGCIGLTSMVVSNENTEYDSRGNCNAIIETATNTLIFGCKNTVIPNSVKSIGSHAFYECTSLTSVVIPNGVTSIDILAFANCSGLTGSLEIPNSVTSIGGGAFYECTSLTSVVIPNSVTSIESIGNSAFQNCSGLTSVTLHSQTVGSWFSGNTSILTVIMGNGVTSIGDWAFNGCSGLTSVEIPNSVTSIGKGAFSGCSGLTSVEIPNSVTSIGQSAFNGCSGLTSVDIPNSVTSIGQSAFNGCRGLTAVVIPNSVTSIGDRVFNGCSGLISVEIPNSVRSIGNYAFNNCSGLASVEIPNSVRSIGDYVFYGCSSLKEVTVERETPITISANVFSNRAKATLYVPAGCKAAYEAAQYWQDFKEIIEMSSGVTVGDLNGDGIVSITDVVLIIDVMAGIITDANKVAAADVNGDFNVTITDCVAAIDLIAAQQGNSPLMAMAPSMQPGGDYISGNYQDGQLTVDLCNENRYTAFQMVVSVPSGMRIVKAKMNPERGEEHQVLVRSIGSGQYLVAGFSLDNEELAGNNGSLLTIMTEGECQGDIVVSDVEFATVDAEAWHLAGITVNGSTTGIADMGTDSGQTVYDLQGHQLDAQILRPDRRQSSKRIVIVNGKKVILK